MRLRWLLLTLVLAVHTAAIRAQVIDRPVADEVWYSIMPIAWRDSNNDEYRDGDIGGLIDSLPYLQTLGITGLWLTPVFPSPAYHGYQHAEADRINPTLGDTEQFRDFVRLAHARGIKVLIDFVVYGINRESGIARSALADPTDPSRGWLSIDASSGKPVGYSFKTWTGDTVGFVNWDLRQPGPVDLVRTWSLLWLDPNGDGDHSDGVDGYRLDHVWHRYDKGPDGLGYHLVEFWEPWGRAVRAARPGAFAVAEQAQWETTGAALLTPDGFDATFAKPLLFAIREGLTTGNAEPIRRALAIALAELPPGKTYLATLGDHDVDRIASVVKGDARDAELAAAILLTLPFPPVIYMGDEIGMLGTKGDFGSDANDIPRREPFKWNAVAGPPMSDYSRRHAGAYDARAARDRDGRSVEEQKGRPDSLLEAHRRLIRLRLAAPALRRGTYTEVPGTLSGVLCFERSTPEQRLLIAINLSHESAAAPLPPGVALRDAVTGTAIDLASDNPLPIAPREYRIVELLPLP
ncbi:MAG: alpha-amylase family glycosyl hydrolase [Phycisphaerales bacterium]